MEILIRSNLEESKTYYRNEHFDNDSYCYCDCDDCGCDKDSECSGDGMGCSQD